MSVIEKVLNSSLYTDMTKHLSESEKEEVGVVVKDMLGDIDKLRSSFLSNISDQDSANEFIDQLLYLFNNKEGLDKWQEKN